MPATATAESHWELLSIDTLSPDQARGVQGMARVKAVYKVNGKAQRCISDTIPVDQVPTWDPNKAWKRR